MYMLDTNIVSDAIRRPHGETARRIAESERDGGLSISIIVAAELRFGMEKRRASTQLMRLSQLLELLPVLPLTVDADERYARIRADLEGEGTPIGANDLFIAAHALSLDATLVTDNVREFARVDGLSVENWLRD